MIHQVAQVVFYVALIYFVVPYLCILAYGPVSSTRHQQLSSTPCYHLHPADTAYRIEPQACRWRSGACLWHRPWKRRPAVYFFAGEPSRWALRFSTTLRETGSPVQVYTLPAGALTAIDPRRMAYRRWDRALALFDNYPGTVTLQQFPTVAAWRQSLHGTQTT